MADLAKTVEKPSLEKSFLEKPILLKNGFSKLIFPRSVVAKPILKKIGFGKTEIVKKKKRLDFFLDRIPVTQKALQLKRITAE